MKIKDKISNKNIIGYGFALLAVILWSGNFVVARGLSSSIHPFALSFYRWTVATIVFTPFALPHIKKDFVEIKKNLKYIFITALIGISSFNTIIYYAGRTTTAINLSLIALTFPIFILLISRILDKEKIANRRILGIIIVISGVLLIVSKGNLEVLLNLSLNAGDPLMLFAAFCFAVHSMLVKNKSQKINIYSFQYATFLVGLIILLPLYLFVAKDNIDILLSSNVYYSILYIGIFSSLVSFVSWNKAIDKIGASSSGMIYFLMPLFSGIIALLFLNETIKTYHLISGLLIVVGIVISNRKSNK